ncbi:lipoprotein [Streptomyces albospinus]|uniref:Lipoprotein n=1 Tax=Streptomyces albospinus TaxID=285515 RepID=A0ABQ2VN86_9ACTN|nr:lipoprotein [Streptomyces albospinus]
MLPLAACQTGGAEQAEPVSSDVSPATSPSAAPDTWAAPGAPGTRTRVACTPDMLRFHAGAEQHPARHMLLTVTNVSDRTCTFAGQPYPLLRLSDRHPAAARPIARSKPRTPVELRPDGTAYATVTTAAPDRPGGRSAPGSKAEKISQFGVTLADRSDPAQVGVDGRAPVPVDPATARVTYWQRSLADAEKW